MMKTSYDVIVVGAGPGGSITAKTCAEGGLDVLLIEKRQEIGDPVRCAEAVAKDDLKKFVNPDKRYICSEIKGSIIISPDGTQIKMSNSKGVYILERKIFDRYLAQQAALAGADIMVKTRAINLLKDNNRTGIRLMYMGKIYDVYSNIVIGADGIESKVGRWAGINTALKLNDIATCAQFLTTNIDIQNEYTKFYLGNCYAPGGYAWIFPKGENSANIGIGINGSKSNNINAISLLQRFFYTHILPKSPRAKIIELVIGGVPVSGPMKQTISDGLILVGDAARQSDPLTGAGIINAMRAGKIAGDVCIHAKELENYSIDILGEYEDAWRKTIGKEIDKSRKIKNSFMTLTDDQLNKFAHSLDGMDISEIRLSELIFALCKNPKILWMFINPF